MNITNEKIKIFDLDYFLISLNSFKYRLAFCLLLTCLGFIVFSIIASNQLTDTAYFGGDTFEYQSMGVNFALGHGMHRMGDAEKFETYKFDSKDSFFYEENFQNRLFVNTFRTPIYPLFLGFTYKIFGISPLLVKYIQLFLLAIVAGFLPFIGYYYWGKLGFISGIIAAPIYLATSYTIALTLMTEALISFVLFLIIICYMFYQSKQTKLSAALLGVILGLGLLTKGSLIFIPFILLVYLFIRFYKDRNKIDLKNLPIIFTSLILTILPWSIFASYHSNSLVILSIQANTILLETNNEDCIDGDWHPYFRVQGKDDRKYLYNRDNMDNYPASYRVVNFYLTNYNLFPKIMLNKIMLGFSTFIFLKISIFIFILGYYSSLLKTRTSTRFYYLLSSVLIIICFAILNRFEINPITEEHIFPLLFILIIPPILFLKNIQIRIPEIMITFFVNFILLTIIFFGDPRYVGVMNFVFILSGVYYLIDYIFNFQKEITYLE